MPAELASVEPPPALVKGLHGVDKTLRKFASVLAYEAAPIVSHMDPTALATDNSQTPCIEVALTHIPLPDDDTPWQDIAGFRDESKHKELLRKLRIWLRKQAKAAAPRSALEEELLDLLSDYRNYMELQHCKFGEGILNILLVSAQDAVTELLNAKIGSAVKAVFSFRERRIALAEAELKAPGREIAYVAKTQDKFGAVQ